MVQAGNNLKIRAYPNEGLKKGTMLVPYRKMSVT
jgi:hypothetical protein